MLFDLRSRGRRTAVRGVYLFLAILIGGGLILFGVGTGTGGGGLLNAITGGTGNQNQVVNSAVQSAEKVVKANPDSASAWGSLVQARWTYAGEGNNFNSSAGTFTAAGQTQVRDATQAWQQYLQLTHGKDPSGIAFLAARAYGALGDYAGEANAWEVVTVTNPNQAKGFECLAASAYAAKQTRKGDLALAKALGLLPKLERPTLKQEIQAAKTTPTVAAQC